MFKQALLTAKKISNPNFPYLHYNNPTIRLHKFQTFLTYKEEYNVVNLPLQT